MLSSQQPLREKLIFWYLLFVTLLVTVGGEQLAIMQKYCTLDIEDQGTMHECMHEIIVQRTSILGTL